jgi:mycothiol system anti-sigma-R factor
MTPDRYTCEQTFRRLDDYVDRALPDDELARVRDHLEICAVCASEYTFEATFISEVRAKLARVTAPASLRERVEALLRE